MTNLISRIALSAAAACVLSIAPVAHAAEVRIDAAGFDVYYDDSLLGLFGTPLLVSGTSLVFTPAAGTFDSLANSPAWAFTGDSFGLRIVADAGYALSSSTVVEGGQLALSGAASEIYAGGVTRAVDSRSTAVSYSPLLGSGAAAIGTAGGTYSRSWEAFSTQLFTAGSTEVQLTIDSLLGSRAGVGGSAYVSKDFVTLSVVSLVTAVPEASTYAMFVLGLGMLGGIARRRMR